VNTVGAFALVAGGVVLLGTGAELLVRGAIAVARLARMSPAVIGLTIVAMGTSLPELTVGITAAVKGSAAVGVGNVMGVNVFNICVVLGMAALVQPMRVHSMAVRLEWPVMFLAAWQCLLLVRDGSLDRLEGAYFSIALLIFTAYVVRIARADVAGEEAKKADFVIIGGYPGFHYQEIKISSLAIRNGAYFYATSRDPYIPTDEGLVPATGSMLASIEVASGQKAIVGGKPEPIIFEVAITRRHLHPKERLAVIGDRLDSDIIGGKNAGITTILVLSGSTKEGDLHSSDLIPDYLIHDLTGLLSEIDTAWNSKIQGRLP